MRDSAHPRVAKNVRAEMARRGLRQADLMKVLGISRQTASNKWNGVSGFEIDELLAIVREYNVPLTALAKFEDFPKAYRIAQAFGYVGVGKSRRRAAA